MPVPAPFGRALCAMVTPFTPDGSLDLDGAQRLADHLVGAGGGCDGIVVSGTTGESPTTTDAEKTALVRAVAEAVGGRGAVVAGVGTSDTRHTVALARAAESAGADGLLVVTPYYSRPPQADIEAHFRTVADAASVPVLLYDIPGRTGTRIEPETLLRLAGHPRIAGVKDCSYDLLGASAVISRTGLAYYSGVEEWNLPLYAVGGAGFISTVANAAGPALRAVLDAHDRGANPDATRGHQRLLPLIELMMASGLPGTVTAKALLAALGLPAGPVRAPLRPAGRETAGRLVRAYEDLLSGAPSRGPIGEPADTAPGTR
ncbi:4-hydroxy-tetrahydrodipicolinate synthase [Streptomyces sp. GC420]|uniref:4-hydroxy-tetrahydrodipicolinate synthase n=1 Tax=Streptomyces sp. GC420 TaxID=2697568 RepID=UPI001414D348|nr:4-hydroxy-tetrahydrodipicolinate synthase [Streptomyces sp. GC420]NBM15645.1 4-hydroxy-tetrahydrodipicolinate synthase [Streptomyces sp. GC420]